jgi:orotate phosphoribosyltransferase
MRRDTSVDDLLAALPVSAGHFLLESGLHTDTWLTLDAIFREPATVAPLVDALARRLRPHDASAVCGPLLGGAFLAHALAINLGVRFYFAAPAGASAASGLFSATYELPPDLRRQVRGERIAVVDDIISAGSSVRATIAALDAAGASTIVVAAFRALGTAGLAHFESLGIPVETLDRRDFNLWPPSDCPLCRTGVAIENPR